MPQLPFPDRIPKDVFISRCETFFDKFKTEYERIETHEVKEMFELYNDKILPRESGTHCGGCRSRVYKKLKAYYEQNK